MTRGMLAALVTAGVVLGLVAAPAACVVPSIGSNADAGSSSSSSGSDAGTATSTAPTTATGAGCTAISPSVSLCQSVSLCPSLTLNAQVFPQCGFRIHGLAIDPECLCDSEYLCPIGNPTTCAEAAAASTGDVTYDSVCEQYLTGHCTDLATGAAPSAACQACIASCDNVPSCIDACGC